MISNTLTTDLKKVLGYDVTNRQLQKAIDKLSENEKEVVLFRYKYNLSWNEISNQMGIKPHNLRTMLGIAYDKMRNSLSLVVLSEEYTATKSKKKTSRCETCQWLNRNDGNTGYCFVTSCKERLK